MVTIKQLKIIICKKHEGSLFWSIFSNFLFSKDKSIYPRNGFWLEKLLPGYLKKIIAKVKTFYEKEY